jgi:hypothetical protein
MSSVIVVSASSDLETRIKAFNCGSDDFIAKPLERVELITKINLLRQRKQRIGEVKQQLEQAHRAAMTAMKNSSELGRVMQFVEHSFSIASVEHLMDAALALLATFNLRAAAMIDISGRQLFFSSEGEIKPIEKELIELLKSKGRFYDFNHRTQVNYQHVSLLIKNMPIDDSDSYGRIKDLLPAIVGCINSRVSEIENREQIISQAHDLVYSFDVIQATMKTLTQSLGNNQKKATERLHNMVMELQIFIQKLGLEEDQEERVIAYVDDAVEESLALLDAGDTIFRSFEEILLSLKDTIERQQQFITRTTTSDQAQSGVKDVSDNNDIELF